MPRVIRDSDEETTTESKSSTRRTRATASSSITDSPARRTTRSNKQLAVIESSPESLDDSSPQPTVRKTRSRAATLDKSSAGVAKNLRSRKNSASSNLSETIDLDTDQQQQTTQKRVTRKAAAAAAAIGTPTKTSLRSRNLRAGSEAKSTPPVSSSRSTRVTRASSVDPINTPNESVVGTPVKRRTRASIVPVQQTVAEEQEDKNEISETVNNTVVEIDEDSENEPVSTKGKSNKKVAKKSSSSSKEKAGKDTSTEQSSLDTSELKIEGNMTDKSCTSNGAMEVEETSEKSSLEALGSHSVTFTQESFVSREQGAENPENIESAVLSADQNLIKSDYPNKNEHVQNNSSVDMVDEYEHVDVENFTLTDESIDVVNSPKKTDVRDTLALDIKDSYVKLDRTKLVEKIVGGKQQQQQLEENKSNDSSFKIADDDRGETSQNDVIANSKTAIVLVNDFVKSNEYFNSMKDEKIFDSGISLNNRGEDVNSNASVHKSDDDQSIITIEDDDEVLSLKLSSPNSHAMRAEEGGDNSIIEALPDDEMSNEDKSIATSVNSSSTRNVDKPDFSLKDNDNRADVVLPESKSNLENVVNENNIEMTCIEDEIGDESGLIYENVGKMDASKMLNASVGINSLRESLQKNDSIEDHPINSSNVKSPSIEVDFIEEEVADGAKVEVGSGGNVEINESALASNDVEAEQLGVIDSSEQLESMDTSSSGMPESNSKENLEIANSRNATTNSNEIESKLMDKTGVPCAVTDADGENASRPPNDDGDDDAQHETSAGTAASKSPEKGGGGGGKRKSQTRLTDSDLDESAENLFQDIPAEEWSAAEQTKSAESKKTRDTSVDSFDGSVVAAAESRDEQEMNGQAKNKRKSLNGKERDRSTVGACDNEEADSSPKQARKSLERKRESGGASSDSGIQNGNKLVVESDSSSDDDDNELPNKSHSRRSLNGSLKVQSTSDGEKLSKSLLADVPPSKSSNKSRKSLNNSMQFNVSVFNTFRKKNDSISELAVASAAERNDAIEHERRDEHSEAMEVDEASGGDSPAEVSRANDAHSRRKSHNKSLAGQSIDDDDEKLSVSLNASSQAAKRSSLDKSLNRSRRKSMAAPDEQVADSAKSVERVTDDESQSKNDSSSGGGVSLNESKKSRNRLSGKMNVSAGELPAESEEMEVDVVDKSPNKSRKSKSLGNSSKSSFDQNEQATPKSGRKSANKSLNVSAANDVVTKPGEDVEKVDLTNRTKVTTESPTKPYINESAEEEEEEEEEEQETVPSALDRSLQKSIDRMKFSNPSKHDVSTVVQVNSSSAEDDSDDSQIPNFIFKLSDEEEEETEDSSEENAENDVDSDVEREYNLGGKDVAKYSDDDVPADDCRVSEEESSDSEDDGADLEDFVVPDEDEDSGDEGEEEGDDDDDESQDENEDEGEDHSDEDGNEDGKEDEGVEMEAPSTKRVSALMKNISINSSQSTVKNSSVQLRRSDFSQSSGSESDDEATEVENKTSKEHFDYVADSEKFLKDSKKLEQQSIKLSNMIEAQNSSLQRRSVADKSLKSAKSNVSLDTSAKEKSLNVSAKNKSLSTSRSGREDKSISKSNSDTNVTGHNGSGKTKSVLLVENGHGESSSCDSDDHEEATSEASEGESVASPSSESSEEEEEGEDYYRIVTAESTKDASHVKPKSKKFIDCSTPKPGAKKPADVCKGSLSMSAASRRKSGSLNDLSNTKMMSSRLSIGEATASKSMKLGDTSMKLKDDVEIVATPETLARPRQAWKLIPLNQTAHPAVEDTPGTKFLKKAKLNESFPVDLRPMRSSEPSSSAKRGKKAAPKRELPKDGESSKKRKLLDLSHAHDEDSILKAAKKSKKRARLNESLASTGDEEDREARDSSEQQRGTAGAEGAQKSARKKKKRNGAKGRGGEEEEEEEAEPQVPAEAQEKPSKKRKDARARATAAEEKPSKKRPKSAGGRREPADSGDEAPESVAPREAPSKRRKQPAQKAGKSLKRLPEDVVEGLADEPLCQRPDKRQKLSRGRERSVMMPSKSMFSPGKSTPENLRVDDGHVPLSSAGGTTQFAVVNLHKARKVAKKSAAVLNFRSKMLARNKRMPTSMYLDYLKRQKAKGNL